MNKSEELLHQYNELKKILELQPDDRPSMISLVKLAAQVNRNNEAQMLLENYLKMRPEDPQLWMALGNLNLKGARIKKALACFLKSSQLKPQLKGIWLALADSYYQLQAFSKVEESLKTGLKLHPNQPVLLNRLAFLYKQMGRQKAAAKLYAKLIKTSEFAAIAHFQLATIMQELNMPRKSIAHYKELLKLNPKHADGHYGLGIAYAFMQDFEKAITCYQSALQCEANHLQSKMELSSSRASICDWTTHIEDRKSFEKALCAISTSGSISLTRATFDINYFNLLPDIHKEVASKCAIQIEFQLKERNLKPFPERRIDVKSEKIKIGYLSPDFREHAVGRLIYEIFRYHNSDRFETFAYNLLIPNESDFVTQAIIQDVDHFENCQDLSAYDIAKKIREDQIDVLIDLVGYTTYCKPAIFAFKPAPIQMHYLGNPGTMGAAFSPYILSDAELIPAEYDKYFTEQIIRLNHGWIASRLPEKIPGLTRASCGLPQDAFVYCSFNFPKKLSPSTFNAWMSILHQVPDSVLWIYAPLEPQQRNLRMAASKSDIDASRIIFADNVSFVDYLAQMRLADVFLDSFFYGAGSTAANALMMGLPVLTLPGETFVSRLGSGVNAAAGMNEWNCKSEEQYIEKAVYWGKHKEELIDFKKGLDQKVKESALCDVKGFVQGVEQQLEQLIKDYGATGK